MATKHPLSWLRAQAIFMATSRALKHPSSWLRAQAIFMATSRALKHPSSWLRAQAIFMATNYVFNESHFDEQAVRALQQLPEPYAMQALNDVAATNNLSGVRVGVLA